MNIRRILTSSIAVAVAAFASSAQAANVVLPADAVSPFGSGDPNEKGFTIRTVQAPDATPFPNSFLRAVQQLNGTLLDAQGLPMPNEAIPGPNGDGSYYNNDVSFELNGLPVQGFNSILFPGIPGLNAHNNNFATEVVGFLELIAGTYTFGVSVAADRTYVNNDDGYVVFVGANPRSLFNTKVGEYERFSPPFAGNVQNTNFFTVDAPVDGIYPFRIVYWQTGIGANLAFFTVRGDPGAEILTLINDPNTPLDAITSYRTLTGVKHNSPYVAEASPVAGSAGVPATDPIVIVLKDGFSPIRDSAVRLFLNDTQVAPQKVTREGGTLTLNYQPNATRTFVNNNVRVEFEDMTGLKLTNSWAFQIVTAGGGGAIVTGQWDFERLDLSATVGQALRYLDGPSGVTATETRFGTCSSLGVSLINGEDARVMEVPYTAGVFAPYGYIMEHGIAPNGGGTRVNQFTLIMDVLIDTTGAGAASLLQMSPGNNDDGDLFWQGNQVGQGTGGYNGVGTLTAGTWHRLAIAYDEAANPPSAAKYVDGIKQDDWTAGHGLDNTRRSLAPTAVLFADGDGDTERRRMWVNSIQIRSGRLTDAELAALSGPTASGVPLEIGQTAVAGQWDFDVNNTFLGGFLAPTVGKPLAYLDGAGGVTETETRFGTCTDLGVALINGEEATIMEVPYVAGVFAPYGYTMTHLIPPNGGGTRVNQFTLIMDVLVDTTGAGAASLLQMTPGNTDDGDLFWQGNNFGQGTGGYNGVRTFTAGAWHRVAIAYDEASNPPYAAKYVDGIKQDDWTAGHGLDNTRRSLAPTAVLFGDGDGDTERRRMWVNSIQIRAGKLSDAQIVALGGPSARGIPVVAPKTAVSGQWDFNVDNSFLNGRLAPTVGVALQYLDGAGGVTQTETRFGTCTELGVALINEEDAQIMEVPYTAGVFAPYGYIMTHLIPPNGGGTRVNRFTLVMDVMVDTTGGGAASLLQMSPGNTDDGDLFWQGNNFGQGTDGYGGTGIFVPAAWHRVAISYDEAASPPHALKYVDGVFQQKWTAGHGLDNVRRSLAPTSVLFADGDGDTERRRMWVNSIQIRAGTLSETELMSLGMPTAAGIPVAITLPTPPPAPFLTIFSDGATVQVCWPAGVSGFRLQGSPSLGNPNWQEIPSANNCATVPLQQTRFFRLVSP